MVNSLILDIGIIVIFAAILALISKFLKQPLVLAYVLAGFLLGPFAFNFIHETSTINELAELGVAFLLFIVGLEFDINKFKQLGWVITITGVLQVLLVAAVTFLFVKTWLNSTEALYIALIIAFSSTMVVVKLLADKSELQTLHGRIILGILLVQDVLAVLAIPLLQSLGNNYLTISISIAKSIALIVVSYFIGKYLFSYILRLSASMPELLFVVALAIGFIYTALASYLGISIIIGAFIAGVALASSPYSTEIIGRVLSLKDFFIIIFFASLGMQITQLNTNINFLLILLVLAIIIKPLILFIILKLFKQSNRTSFSTSFSLGQISEFSLVIAGTGVALGHIASGTFALVIILGTITITLTSYVIKYDRHIYSFIHPILNKIETNHKNFNIEKIEIGLKNHIVLIGAHRMASRIIQTLKEKKEKFIVLDFNPEKVKLLIKKGINCVYGDYGNLYVLENLNIAHAKTIVSTVPSLQDNIRLIKLIREKNKHAIIFIAAHKAMDALLLYKEGADLVIFPEYLSGQKVADYMTHLNIKNVRKWGKYYREQLIDEIRNNNLFI